MKHFLKRTIYLLVPAALGTLALTVPASAGPDPDHSASGVTPPALLALITNDDVFSTTDLTTVLDPAGTNATQHYGPYPTSASPDSGTCGNTWAEDSFDRFFTVRPNGDGTFTVVEQFKNGSFITNAGASPGACDTTDGSPPGTIDADKTGSMHGYFLLPTVTGPQTSTDQSCVAEMPSLPCTTAGFVNSHFPCAYPSAPCDVPTFFFHYSAGDQMLVEHEWKNASPDRGRNNGDIASAYVP
jgi:hypothetical protein